MNQETTHNSREIGECDGPTAFPDGVGSYNKTNAELRREEGDEREKFEDANLMDDKGFSKGHNIAVRPHVAVLSVASAK